MRGFDIFMHSFRQVTGNIAVAFRVSWWLVAVLLLEGALVFYGVGDVILGSRLLTMIWSMGNLIFIIWSVSLIAVVWHRFVLLEEVPQGIIPYRKGMNVWPYFWYGVGVVMVVFLFALVVGFVLGVIIRPSTMLQSVIFGLAVGILSTTVFYRIALILPAVALSKSMSIPEAFAVTRGFIGPIFGLVIATVVFNFGINTLIDQAFGIPADAQLIEVTEDGIIFATGASNAPLYLFISGVLQWFVFMLSISILTTLYGHLVEKREIF